MIFKFKILSDEVDNFQRIINIDSEATFLELHDAILDSVEYEKNQITSFFTCSDDWEKQQEVTLVEMESSSEYDNLVMEETKLDELLTNEKQKLLYIFDMILERAFFIELSEIITGKTLEKAECVLTEGFPPVQTLDDDAFIMPTKITVEENFYGDEEFDIDEMDDEGFGEMNFDDSSLF
jgi:hypothetical protein